VSSPGSRPSVNEISDGDRALIQEHNQLDAELYEFAVELFQEALAAAGANLAADVERLRGVAQAAREEHQAAVDGVREWLHRELPAGSTESMRSLIARAEAAGFSRAAVTEARKELLVMKEKDGEGKRSFRRASDGSMTALDEAAAWLDQELPPGATELRQAVIERGEAAGLSNEALNRARKRLSVNKVQDDQGHTVWTRPARSY
jgi:hypothetical protein